MSAFAALAGIDGDTDVAAAALKKREDADREAEAEAQAARLRFDELKAKGLTNWADSDEDDDAFFASAPLARVSKPAPMDDEAEEDEADVLSDTGSEGQEWVGDADDDADDHVEGMVGRDDGATAPVFEVQQSRRKKAPKKDEEEIDSLLAELDMAKSKEDPHSEGVSKAALKRAKKKAQQVNGMDAQEADARVAEAPAISEEGAGAGGETSTKSAEEVRHLMKARAEAAKKKKKTAPSAAVAAAEAASKARGGKPKAKRDKSHYNQQPA